LKSAGRPINPQKGVHSSSATEYQIATMLFQMVYGVHTPVDTQKIQKIVEGNPDLIFRIRRDYKNSK